MNRIVDARPQRTGVLVVLRSLLFAVFALSQPLPLWGQDAQKEVQELRAQLDRSEHASVLEAVIRHVRAETVTVDLALLGSEAALHVREWNHARSLADIAVAKAPKDPRGYLWNGHALFRMAEDQLESSSRGGFIGATFSDSADSYARARALLADPFSTAVFEAEARFMASELEKALLAIDDALALRPDEITSLQLKGRILEALKRMSSAGDVYEHAFSVSPGDVVLARQLLRSRLQSAEKPVVRILFLKLAATFPDDLDLYEAVFQRYINEAPPRFLAETLVAATQLTPPSAHAFPHWYLGLVSEASSRFQEALQHLATFKQMRPQSPFGDWRYGVVLVSMERLQEARESLLRALALGGLPNDKGIEGLGFLIRAYVDRKEFADATSLQRVLLSLSGSPNDELDLGTLEYNSGQRESAIAIYQRLDARDDVDIAFHARVANYLALAQLGVGNPEKAEAAFRRSLEFDDEGLDARENLGILLLSSGRSIDGLAALERVLSRSPERVRTQYHYLRTKFPAILGVRGK